MFGIVVGFLWVGDNRRSWDFIVSRFVIREWAWDCRKIAGLDVKLLEFYTACSAG